MEERKQAEGALKRGEQEKETILNSLMEHVIYEDTAMKILWANQVACESAGLPFEELIGRHCYEIWPKRSTPCPGCPVVKTMETGQPQEVEKTTPDGRSWFIRGYPIRDVNGDVTGAVEVTLEITKRKEAEELYRSVVELSPESIITVDTKGVITSCNPAATRMLGYPKDEMIGKHFSKIGVLRARDLPKYLELFTSVLRGKVTKPLELTFYRKDGNPLLAEVRVSLLKEGDKTIGLQAISRDITERKKAEEELVRLSTAVNTSIDGIIICDMNGNVIDVNEAVLKKHGIHRKGDMIGKNASDFIAPEDLEKLFVAMREMPQKGYIKGVEYHILTEDGSKIPVEANGVVMKGKDGKPIGFVATVRDITERKEMEEKLRQYSEHLEELVQKRTEELLESEKRYSVLVEEARDGVAIIQDRKFLFTNNRLAEIVGYSRDELIGVPFLKLADEKSRQLVKERYERRLRGEEVPATYEAAAIAKDGERVPVELSATRINYQGRHADLVIVRDIRERKRMEEERLKLERLAAIGELATMVGHDLRNPLQSIENAIYCLNKELPHPSPSAPISQKAVEMLQVINDSVNYADKIIRDLHEFSATKKPTLKKTDVNVIVKDALSQVEVPEKMGLITELGRLPRIEADKDMIKRVFLNLAINGIQAMKENGGTLKVSTKKTKGFVEISFEDTGIGMPKEDMKKLFTPFFTTKAKGMGMGLAICKKFVEIHGGIIEVESEEGKGSVFEVKLPIQQENGGEKLDEQ